MREMICEEVRQRHFPDRPSRLQSFFYCGTIEDAKRYRDGFERPDALIWEVECGEAVWKGDMRWMRECPQVEIQGNSAAYWRGDCSSEPLWEYLLRPPVRIVRHLESEC